MYPTVRGRFRASPLGKSDRTFDRLGIGNTGLAVFAGGVSDASVPVGQTDLALIPAPTFHALPQRAINRRFFIGTTTGRAKTVATEGKRTPAGTRCGGYCGLSRKPGEHNKYEASHAHSMTAKRHTPQARGMYRFIFKAEAHKPVPESAVHRLRLRLIKRHVG